MVITTHEIIPENQDMTIKNKVVQERISKLIEKEKQEKNPEEGKNPEQENDKKKSKE